MTGIIYNFIAVAALVFAVLGWADNRRRLEMKSLKMKLIHEFSGMDSVVYQLKNVGQVDVQVHDLIAAGRAVQFPVSMAKGEPVLRRNLHYQVTFFVDAHTRALPPHVEVIYRSWTGKQRSLAVLVPPEPPYDPHATNQPT
ncbi:hypothetical protein G7068_11855 [Leucobacter viscericola]|uniref:Uncharacterized protein n=1 Tax=Leucobacter viscericola TaxID=2714935 RepID=A0A6G7XGX9_9MICO|nr:hypothetical protein [Leucobacter viscericola]QIK63803.1 hypothetical protein G7068_11855 [Leucobacter viscericola]